MTTPHPPSSSLRSLAMAAKEAEDPDFTPDETDPWFVLDFCEGAIRDAVRLEDGLDGAAGEAVLQMITNARIARRAARSPIVPTHAE